MMEARWVFVSRKRWSRSPCGNAAAAHRRSTDSAVTLADHPLGVELSPCKAALSKQETTWRLAAVAFDGSRKTQRRNDSEVLTGTDKPGYVSFMCDSLSQDKEEEEIKPALT